MVYIRMEVTVVSQIVFRCPLTLRVAFESCCIHSYIYINIARLFTVWIWTSSLTWLSFIKTEIIQISFISFYYDGWSCPSNIATPTFIISFCFKSTNWTKERYSLKSFVVNNFKLFLFFFSTMMSKSNTLFKGIYSPPYFISLARIPRYPPVVVRPFALY